MYKLFCDACGEEITDNNKFFPISAQVTIGGVTEEIRIIFNVSSDISGRKADVCKYCIKQAFDSLFIKPKEVAND